MTEQEPLQPVTDSQMMALEEAVSQYEAGMTVEAAQYLLGRGLTQETVVSNRLGVVTDPLPGHEPFRGMIAIPFMLDGKPLRIRFRCMQNHDHSAFSHGKYMQPTGESIMAYNVGAIDRAGDTIHVTEGEFDAMILNQVGLPAIGFPGASTFKPHHGRMLAGMNRVWVWGDPDQAGAEFVQKILNRLPRSARGVKLRGGDVTDTFLAGGAKALHNLVKDEQAA